MTMSNITIAVTGMNSNENPGPGVSVIRALRAAKDFKGTIVGFTYDPLDPGVFMEDICDHVYLIPYPSEGSRALLDRLKEIQSQTPVDVIIPTLDSELPAFISMEKELGFLGIKTFLPTKECFELRSKARFNELSQELGISVPQGKSITTPYMLRNIHNEFDFPIMIKGQFYDACMAHTPLEADHQFRMISAKWGLPVIVQEYIAGEEFDVVALGDGKGGLVGAVPMKKMQLTDKGKAWGGVTICDPEMNEFVIDVMAKIKWRGPCELEIMKSHRDGKYYLLEINPRFPAWSYLSAGAGQNLQWATVQLALGEEVPPFESYDVGIMFLRNSIDHIYPLSEFQEMTTIGELHRQPEIGNHGLLKLVN